jgi:hypothetical protein
VLHRINKLQEFSTWRQPRLTHEKLMCSSKMPSREQCKFIVNDFNMDQLAR